MTSRLASRRSGNQLLARVGSGYGGVSEERTANPDGPFQLFRIGDAVAARNTQAAIYNALRLVKDP